MYPPSYYHITTGFRADSSTLKQKVFYFYPKPIVMRLFQFDIFVKSASQNLKSILDPNVLITSVNPCGATHLNKAKANEE